jgi:hypothetical protein
MGFRKKGPSKDAAQGVFPSAVFARKNSGGKASLRLQK